ncbi:glycogen/starch synthase [bacterium]|nr:glycogen/starch synthase [bacterium]
MKILFAASELKPMVSTGNMAASVAKMLRSVSKKCEVVCVLPLFSAINRKKFDVTPTGVSFEVQVGEKFEKAEIFEAIHEESGAKVVFVANPYFERDGLYGNDTGDYPDNSERFVFFSRAVLEYAKIFRPDIIHCNDWHTALVPVYLREIYCKEEPLQNTKTVFSLHDIRFQGKFWSYDFGILNLGREVFVPEKLEFYGDINFLKGGIVYSDAVTVSNDEYLEQIQTKEGGCGLEGLVSCSLDKISVVKRSDKFVEIYKKL